jgi:hypothetical protein
MVMSTWVLAPKTTPSVKPDELSGVRDDKQRRKHNVVGLKKLKPKQNIVENASVIKNAMFWLRRKQGRWKHLRRRIVRLRLSSDAWRRTSSDALNVKHARRPIKIDRALSIAHPIVATSMTDHAWNDAKLPWMRIRKSDVVVEKKRRQGATLHSLLLQLGTR